MMYSFVVIAVRASPKKRGSRNSGTIVLPIRDPIIFLIRTAQIPGDTRLGGTCVPIVWYSVSVGICRCLDEDRYHGVRFGLFSYFFFPMLEPMPMP